MNTDKALLCCLLYDVKGGKNIEDRLRIIEAQQHPFSSENAPIFQMIRKHIIKFKKAPSIKTIQEKFENFTPEKPDEPLDYYVEQAAEDRKRNHMMTSMARAERYLEEGDFRKAQHEIINYAHTASLQRGGEVEDTFMKAASKRVVQEYIDQQKLKLEGVKTGLKSVDEVTGGLTESDFVVIMARPGNFKTFLLSYTTTYMATHGKNKVLIVSREMTPRQLRKRIMGYMGQFDFNRVKLDKLTPKELKHYEQRAAAMKGDIIIIESPDDRKLDIPYIESKIHEHKPDIICVDALYRFGRANWEESTDLVRAGRDLGLQFKIPVVATWQLNRSGGTEDDPLRGAALTDAIGQDASIVLYMERQFDETLKMPTNKVKCSPVKYRDAELGIPFILTFKFQGMGVLEGEHDLVAESPWDLKVRNSL